MKKFIITVMSVFLFANIANAIELKGVWIAFNVNEDNELWFYDHNNQLKDYEIGRARVGKECRSRWSPYH